MCVAEKQLLIWAFVPDGQDFTMSDAVPWYHHHIGSANRKRSVVFLRDCLHWFTFFRGMRFSHKDFSPVVLNHSIFN